MKLNLKREISAVRLLAVSERETASKVKDFDAQLAALYADVAAAYQRVVEYLESRGEGR